MILGSQGGSLGRLGRCESPTTASGGDYCHYPGHIGGFRDLVDAPFRAADSIATLQQDLAEVRGAIVQVAYQS